MARTQPLSARPTLGELKRKLTAKQLAYAQALAKGGISKIEAYKRAYNVNPARTRSSISRDATVVSHHPTIIQAVDVISEAYSKPELRDAAATRAFVLEVLRQEALGAGPDTRASARIAAAQALGSVNTVGMFVDRKEVIHRQAGPDTAVELVERLKSLAAQINAPREPIAPAIDVQPVLELAQAADLATDDEPVDLTTIGNSK